MKKILYSFFAVVMVLSVFWWLIHDKRSVSHQQIQPSPETHVYRDAVRGFSITLPTEIASSTEALLYSVDPLYQYTVLGPNKSISGVKFTIPQSMAGGTNLSDDSYISVEHLTDEHACDISSFLGDRVAAPYTFTEGDISYVAASSTDAAAGNRYEEYVYLRLDATTCVAVRYFIHYAVIDNFPAGTVRSFDKASLLSEFDQIRKTLTFLHD